MNPITQNFADSLNASDWMGVIYEAGFGIPFQSNYLNIPGASNTILFTGCLYNKAFQPVLKRKGGGFQRSVSNEMVEEVSNLFACQAETTILLDIEKEVDGGSGFKKVPPIFSLTVSGAQSSKDGNGASHGWVNIGVIVNPGTLESQPDIIHSSFHFFNHKDHQGYSPSREEVGAELCKSIQWFMEKILLGKYANWSEAIDNIPDSNIIRIDVIRDNDIRIEDHLKLARSDTPLVFDGDEFKRPVDYFRKYNKVYRGSFNPITVTHTALGRGSLFEISLDNIRKANVSLRDIAGRIDEIVSTGNPVLITKGHPTFVAFDKFLSKRGGSTYQYIVGADTFNAIISDKYNPSDDYLKQFYAANGSSFLAVTRTDTPINDNHRSEKIAWSLYDVEYDPEVSSTRARSGEVEMIPEEASSLAISRLKIS